MKIWDEDEWQKGKRNNDFPYIDAQKRERFRLKRKKKKSVKNGNQ